jgi:aminoglycoside 6'-N-acetyltransferase I
VTEIRIRPVRREDTTIWRDMRAALYNSEDPSLLTEVEGYFTGDPMIAAAFIAEDARPVGFIELSLRNYAEGCDGSLVPYVEGIYVEDGRRRQDIGRLLMAAAEHWAKTQSYIEMASDARIDNDVSRIAHKAYGFEEVERIVCFRKSL